MSLLQDSMPCPTSGCSGTVTKSSRYKVRSEVVRWVGTTTPTEFFQATKGLGLPLERLCGPSMFSSILNHRIAAVSVEEVPGTTRSLIHSITLQDGRTLHLSGSTKGATVYKVTRG